MEGDDFSCPPVRSREWRGALLRWGEGQDDLAPPGRERVGEQAKQRNKQGGRQGCLLSLIILLVFSSSIFRLLLGEKYRI